VFSSPEMLVVLLFTLNKSSPENPTLGPHTLLPNLFVLSRVLTPLTSMQLRSWSWTSLQSWP
jgi:hypothetical protein